MSSSDESVRYVGESNPDDDPFEATSKMAGSQSAGPSSGRRRSLRRMAAAFHRLIDEKEEKTEGETSSPGEEEKVVTNLPPVHHLSSVDLGPSSLQTSHITQMTEEFFIHDSQVIYTPGPRLVLLFPQPTLFLSFLPKCVRDCGFPFLPSTKK
ncbi:UNVERIFIED_CONTAM: hypothetical protein Slati_3500800 [Sesamum latifolium]|uniref:Uncharacterized protein n=1 Tax=Sesamum latifolium TaxID=2727402 RepID=A0AAW2UI63_9LAMI